MTKMVMSSGVTTEPNMMLRIIPPKSATMRSMRTPRFFLVAVLAILLSALAGGFFGGTAQATQDQVSQQYRIFTAALTAVDREHVEPLPSARLIYDAIGGAVPTPHPPSAPFRPPP